MNGNNGTLLERDEVDSLMASIYIDLGITPKDVKIGSGSDKGDGYLSFLTRVDVTAEDGKELHVVLKCAPRLESIRKYAPIHEAFDREIYFYESILPVFHKFQTERQVPLFSLVPKCYKSQIENFKEIIILENIKIPGFQLWNRLKPMDDSHMQLVFRTYGQLHAISYAMQQHSRENYQELTDPLKDVFSPENFGSDVCAWMITLAEQVHQVFENDDENGELSEKLKNFAEGGLIDFWKSLANDFGQHPVILHGDCWVNNMMFKYGHVDNPGNPTDIRLLDFQLCKAGSPVLDLSYFFYVSVPGSSLDKYADYLKIYHESLTENLSKMDSKCPLSFDSLLSEWKCYGRFGFLMSMMVSKAMLSEKDEVIDFTDINDDNIEELKLRKCKNDDVYLEKMRLLALHLHHNLIL